MSGSGFYTEWRLGQASASGGAGNFRFGREAAGWDRGPGSQRGWDPWDLAILFTLTARSF